MQRKYAKFFAYAKVFFMVIYFLLHFPIFLLNLKSVEGSFSQPRASNLNLRFRMRMQLLFLLYYLAANEAFSGGLGGGGPLGKRVNCTSSNAQLVIGSQGANEEISLNQMVIARSLGMSGSGLPAQGAFIALKSKDFLEIRELVRSAKNLRIKNFNEWLDVKSLGFDSNNELINMKLENHLTIQIYSEDDGGISGGGGITLVYLAEDGASIGQGAGGNIGKSSASFANEGCIVIDVGGFTGGGGSINDMVDDSDVDGETPLAE